MARENSPVRRKRRVRQLRSRARRRGAWCVAALWAMLVQAMLPLVHGPHGSEGPAPSSERWTITPAGPTNAALRQAPDDCADCPVCQAVHSAAQPLVTPGVASLETTPTRCGTAVPAGRSDGEWVRVRTDAAPRGPPRPVAC